MSREEDERLWAPDAEVTFDHREPTPFVSDRREHSSGSSRSTQMRRWQRWPFVAGAVCVVVAFVAVAAIISQDRSEPTDSASTEPDSAASVQPEFERLPTPDPLDSDGVGSDTADDIVLGLGDVPLAFVPGECLRHRLPRSIDPRWVTDLPPDHGVGGQESIGDEVVVLPIRRSNSVDSSSTVELLALDLVDGSERWRVGLGSLAEPPEIVDVFAGVAIVQLRGEPVGASTLVGISEGSGVELWRHAIGRGVEVLADPDERALVVYDTDVVFDDLGDSQPSLTWVDPTTFRAVNSVAGRFRGVRPDGSLIVDQDGNVSIVRAASGRAVETAWPAGSQPSPFTLLGSGVLIAADDSLDLIETNPSGKSVQRTLQFSGSARIDPPSRIVLLDALGDSSVIVGSPGAVYGAAVVDDSIELRWRRGGIAIGAAASDRGRTLLLRRDGVAVTDVVDASTGRTVVELPRPPVVTLYANGVLVAGPRESGEPALRTAYDLDGRELWSLANTISTIVGDRVVVAVTLATELVTDGSRPPLRVTAHGRATDEPARCDGVVQD